jgi:uncharacterized protein (TIGR03067 family)
MRFTKLKVLAALAVAVLGLTTAFAAVPGSTVADPAPARAALVVVPAGIAARPVAQAEEDKAAKELKALQGAWQVIKAEAAGEEVPAEQLARRRILIENDVLSDVRNPNGSDPHKVKIKLDPGKSPKEIDVTPLDGPDKDKATPGIYKGIYKLDDDKLTICLPLALENGAGRPKEFKADKTTGLTVLERVKDEKEELAALAGEWKAVKATVSGKEIPADELEKGWWRIKGAEVAIVGVGEEEGKAALKLDPAAVPPTIDMTITEGPDDEKGTVHKGIYFRQGDKLTIAFRDPQTKKDDRPTELKPGDDVDFVIFERAPKK